MHGTESNGENLEGASVSKRQKVNQKNGNKESKGSLRRRMRLILTSPVHLFRRFVLRKRPKKYSKKGGNDGSVQNLAGLEYVETAKERNVPCYFLFLGLKQSGKSTTISKLFNGKRPTLSNSTHDCSIKIYKNASVGQNIGLKVVDTPGLCGNEDKDAALVKSLASFLKRDLPNRIPTVTFIVARLDDDNLDESEQSQFSQMLKILSQVENFITDHLYSNLVLLLTHSQKANNVSDRISKYQHAFAKVFPITNPIHVIAIDNIRYYTKADEKLQNYHDIIFGGLKDFAGKRQEHSIRALIDWFTGKPKRFSILFEEEIWSSECLPDLEFSSTLKEKTKTPQEDYEPYFVMHHSESNKNRRKSQKLSSSQPQQQMLTGIPPGSQITLSDKSLINIDKCLVGDKVLGLFCASSVITGIRKASAYEVALEGKSVGNIYCCAIQNEMISDEKTTGKFIYMQTNDKFELVDASKANVPETTSTESLYFLELDSPNGTFIVNAFPCFPRLISDLTEIH